jgi:hypothetical protein
VRTFSSLMHFSQSALFFLHFFSICSFALTSVFTQFHHLSLGRLLSRLLSTLFFIYMLFLPGQTVEAWEPSKK